ncbi:MAG TPA: hypothetical protein VGI19_14595 [Candidatus Cybelea sp.]
MLDDNERLAATLEASLAYLKSNAEFLDDLQQSVDAMGILFDLMPQDLDRMFSGHIIPISEAAGELEAAIQLALRGFYRQAFATLRVLLELGIFSVYLDASDQSHEEVKSWLRGGLTPHPKMMLTRLGVIPDFRRFFEKFDVSKELLAQYERLNHFVHVRGARHTSRALNRTNTRAFNSRSFGRLASGCKLVVQYIVALHILKYPIALQKTPIDEKFGLNGPVGTFLRPHQAEELRRFVGPDWASALQAISDSDEYAVDVAQLIRAMPDVSDEEFQRQSLDQDKYFISGEGFKSWEARETREWDKFEESLDPEVAAELREAGMKRLELLRKWATENDVLDAEGALRYRERLYAKQRGTV